MQNKILFSVFFLTVTHFVATVKAQVTIGSLVEPNPSALLDLKENPADGTSTKGLVLPRVKLQSTDVPAPLKAHVMGMFVYNTEASGSGATAVTEGVYYNDGAKWIVMTSGTATALRLEEDAIIGNEVTDATNVTLTRSGSGTTADPYTLARAAITGDVSIPTASNAAELATVTRSRTTSTVTAAHAGTFTAIDSVTTDTKGRVTAVNMKTVTLPNALPVITVQPRAFSWKETTGAATFTGVTSPTNSTVLTSSTISVTATGATSYQWYEVSRTGRATAATGTGNNTATYTPPGGALGMHQYYCVVSNALGSVESKIAKSANSDVNGPAPGSYTGLDVAWSSGGSEQIRSDSARYYGKFITAPSTPYDWSRDPTGENVWLWRPHRHEQNDPCVHVTGVDGGNAIWRIPNQSEWGDIWRGGSSTSNPSSSMSANTANTWVWHAASNPTNGGYGTAGGYEIRPDGVTTTLFLPAAGHRYNGNGQLYYSGLHGFYWSATAYGPFSYYLNINSGNVIPANYTRRAYGFSVRCVAEL